MRRRRGSKRAREVWLAATMLLAGCATAPVAPPIPFTGDPVVDNLARRDAGRPVDWALWAYRAGAAALRRGDLDTARAALDDGLARAAAATGAPSAEAARARRTFGREADKPFVGEPYEQVMANFYRGLAYWQAGDRSNARALFRNGLFIDGDPATGTLTGDWVLLEYLDGWLTERLGGSGTAALARARAAAGPGRTLPDFNGAARVMVVVEYGRGPGKYSAGEYGEQLRFRPGPARVAAARLRVAGEVVELPPWDDLYSQATTRGGRVMDHILGNQAVFKRGAEQVGDAALAGAIITNEFGAGHDRTEAALAMAAVGLMAKLLSGAAAPDADTRTWDNLPAFLSFAALELSAGEHAARLEFLDGSGVVVESRTQEFTIVVPERGTGVAREGEEEELVFRSEVPN